MDGIMDGIMDGMELGSDMWCLDGMGESVEEVGFIVAEYWLYRGIGSGYWLIQ